MNEEAIRFGPQRSLVGIVTDAGALANPELPAVVLLNAGLMHRVGPNRTYVQLARALAARGHTVMRFDFSGLGDSRPRADHLPYLESAPREARDAMDWLADQRGAHHFILIGHCAGAGVALLVARDDARVAAAVLINMEGGDASWTEYDRMKKVSQMHARDYGTRALFSRERWAKVLSGRADYRSIARVVFKDIIWYRLASLRFQVKRTVVKRQPALREKQASLASAYLDPIINRGGAMLLLHSEGSTGLEQIRATFGAELDQRIAAGSLDITIINQSDHLFTLVARQRRLCDELVAWVGQRCASYATKLVATSDDH
ncbi:alpha/beta fold hydrolase [Candidatus Chloroploca sp. Khr17]|uniref:alpha/beta fold hydrolase n=1 Tax=Candidatus Chloroploca sp. Khr17 TaxID=2496869 RepID=UPI0013EA3AC1|nr:alpha/beta fold hydrolase [Candidatus Chloroploca sp. Khr17]